LAVYTPLSKSDIDAFLMHYDVGVVTSYKGIAEGVENTNYLLFIEHKGVARRYILTLYEQRVNVEDLPFFLELTEWLSSRGIKCPRPVAGKGGQKIHPIKGRPAALIQFLDGRGSPHITPRHLELTGELIANMHLAADGFTMMRRNNLSVEGWQELFSRFNTQADDICPGLRTEIGDELTYLSENWPSGLPAGIVHADIFPDNVFFIDGDTDQPEISGVIDFYFACHDFWIYDLLICMNAWCFDTGHKFVRERAQALLRSYDRVRPITNEERVAMPLLARGAAMRFLVTRAYDWLNRVEGALVNPKDPMEYVTKLRFHRSINHWRDYCAF
jgi:homoserine kinase type II